MERLPAPRPLDVAVAAYALAGLVPALGTHWALLAGAVYFAASRGLPRIDKPVLCLWLITLGGAAAALFSIVKGPIPGLLLAAPLWITAGLLIVAEIASASFVVLIACAAVQVFALWKAQSRAAFAALIAGGLWWALRRQTGRRRLLLLLGAFVFVLGAAGESRASFSARSGAWQFLLRQWLAHPFLGCGQGHLRLDLPAYAVALAETGVIGLALQLAAPCAFLLWFLGEGPTLAAEGPALAALALFSSGFISPALNAQAYAGAIGAMGIALGLSNPAKDPA